MVDNRFVTQWLTDAHEVLKVYAVDGRVRARDCAADRRRHFRRSPASGRTPKASTRSRRSRTPARSTATTSRPATSTVFRQPKVDFSPSAFETTQVFYPSKDGTKIPMFITVQEGPEEGRAEPDLSLRLRRLQRLADAGVLARR